MPPLVVDLLALLNLLGAVQAFFLSLTLATARTGNRLASRFLAAGLFCTGFNIVETLLCHTNLIYQAPFLIDLGEPLDLIGFPLLLLYTLALIQPQFRLRARHSLLFLPAGLYAIYMLPYYLQPAACKLNGVAVGYGRLAQLQPCDWQDLWWFPTGFRSSIQYDILLLLFNLAFLGLLTFYLFRYYRQQRVSFGQLPQPVRWLVRVLIYLVLMIAIFVTFSFWSDYDLGDIYIATASSALMYAFSFHLLIRSEVLQAAPTEPKKAVRSALPAEALPRLLAHMNEQRPWLNPELNLPELAAQLKLSTHQLSQLINEGCQQHFFDFVNSYRIAAVQQALVQPEKAHLKIEGLAFACGFNSKSAFNAAFRKHVGNTPSGYRQKHLTTP